MSLKDTVQIRRQEFDTAYNNLVAAIEAYASAAASARSGPVVPQIDTSLNAKNSAVAAEHAREAAAGMEALAANNAAKAASKKKTK
jgi:hypothetical protein